MSCARQLGGAFGVAIPAVFLTWREVAYAQSPGGITRAYAESFMLVAAVFFLSIVATLVMQAAHRRAD